MDTNTSLLANRNIQYDANGDIGLTSPHEPVVKKTASPATIARLVAAGIILPRETKPNMVASANQFNGGNQAIVLSPKYTVEFVDGEEFNEAAWMERRLAAVRAGEEAVITCMRDQTHDAIEEEHIGEHFSVNPDQY